MKKKMAINMRTAGVYGYHRRKAIEEGTMWSIHWKDGRVGNPFNTEATYYIAKGKVNDISYIENISMRDYLGFCLEQAQRGMAFSVFQGCLYCIEEDYYIEKKDTRIKVDEMTARRELQIYYTLEPEELVGDQSYIEEKITQML
jgi:hypothetical protein